MSELLPCPFCGGKSIIVVSNDKIVDTEKREWKYTVVCDKCCATSGLGFSKDQVIKAWNTRKGGISDE